MMEWRPIETAPEDGTEVLLWLSGFVGVARQVKKDVWVSDLKYDTFNPTHWMPLPEGWHEEDLRLS